MLVDDHQGFVETDIEMHELIAKAACNSILERFMASISQLGQVSRRRTVELPGIPFQSVQDHAAIIRGIESA